MIQYHWNTRPGGRFEGYDIRQHFQTTELWRKSNWDIYAIDDNVTVDFLIKFESLSEGLDFVAQKLGISQFSIPRAKSGHSKDKKHYSEILPSEIEKELERICYREISHLGYRNS